MKTVIMRAFGPPSELEIIDSPEPTPKPHEVVVKVTASGVGFVDGLLIQGLYQVKPNLPYFPGSEFAGVVSQVGAEVSTHSVGERVFGLANRGGFSEKVCLPASSCYATPKQMHDNTAAAFFINYATALYGLRNIGGLRAGENILILGASGGVGSAAICVARAMGANVIAGASSAEKLTAARTYGAQLGVNYSQSDWRQQIKEATAKTGGLNVVYDPVGGDLAEPALRSLVPGGRFLVVGFVAGIPKIGLNLALLKQCAILGVDWGGAARANPELNTNLLETLLDWVSQQTLTPADPLVRDIAGIREALEDQLARNLVGKLVLSHAK